MKKFIIILLLLFLTLTSFARIGEDLEQCIERYGDVVLVNEGFLSHHFVKNGFIVSVHFYNKVVDAISYVKLERNEFDVPEEITDNEIRILLESNSEFEWIQREIDSVDREYQNRECVAVYYTIDSVLYIMTIEGHNRRVNQIVSEEEEAMSGF